MDNLEVAWVAEHAVLATILRLSWGEFFPRGQTVTVGIVEGENFWGHQPLCNFVARYDLTVYYHEMPHINTSTRLL